jgi:carboxypeptidase C (cathepsin A)
MCPANLRSQRSSQGTLGSRAKALDESSRRRAGATAALLFALTCITGARADDPPLPLPPTATSVTHHVVSLANATLRYTVTAGRIVLVDKRGEPAASMFSVAYTCDGFAHAQRPVAFLWNGGPGSSSLWLHMGSFGPLRVATNDTGTVVPPGRLVPNDGTLLDTTDLVFIDAPGTGFSRIGAKGTKEQFYGVDQDARAFTQFIERWLTQNDRWGSPKFLIGESYGTTRAANVVDRLQSDGVGINGVVLVSSALNLTALDPALPGDEMSNISFLPTEAAVAWYHNALPGTRPAQLEPFLAQVRDFARGPYATALLRGDALDEATRRDMVAQLHRFTGLDEAYIDRADLRIDPTRFEKELLRDRRELTGRLDGRFTGYDLDRNSDSPAYDPTLDAGIADAFVGEFNRYIRDDLHFVTDDRYLPTNYPEIGPAWNLTRDATDVGLPQVSLPNVLPDLAQALTRNPALRVFSANGYFDLATPFFGTEKDLHHLELDPALRSHITFGYYPSGHMIYLEPASRRALRTDIEAFMRSALPK